MSILVFFVALQIADGLLTYHGIREIGIHGYESNPALVYYMHRFGVVETLCATKIVGLLLGYLAYRMKKSYILWLMSGFYLNNLFNQIMFFFYSAAN